MGVLKTSFCISSDLQTNRQSGKEQEVDPNSVQTDYLVTINIDMETLFRNYNFL